MSTNDAQRQRNIDAITSCLDILREVGVFRVAALVGAVGNAIPVFFVNKRPLALVDLQGANELRGLGPEFYISRQQAEASAERLGQRIWPYHLCPRSAFILPSTALLVRLDSVDKRYFREALLESGHDLLWVRTHNGAAAVPLIPDIVFSDAMGSIPIFGAAPSVQRLNEAPPVKIIPAKTGRMWRAVAARCEREV